ncbi:MAG TPA: SRPBCC family protein [Thermoleophilaceae bacterium]|nr:SRPBCC family protein [Thermoleophilaceae bacterium]
MSERSVEHATIVIERRYPASPERTFAAWANAAAKARWMGVPEGGLELDFRVGGEESHSGTLPDGRVYTYEAVYQDIVRPRRIVYTYEMHLDDTRISISLATVEFTPEHDGTRLVFTEQGAFLDGHEPPASRDEGMGGLLDALGKELQSEQRSR